VLSLSLSLSVGGLYLGVVDTVASTSLRPAVVGSVELCCVQFSKCIYNNEKYLISFSLAYLLTLPVYKTMV